MRMHLTRPILQTENRLARGLYEMVAEQFGIPVEDVRRLEDPLPRRFWELNDIPNNPQPQCSSKPAHPHDLTALNPKFRKAPYEMTVFFQAGKPFDADHGVVIIFQRNQDDIDTGNWFAARFQDECYPKPRWSRDLLGLGGDPGFCLNLSFYDNPSTPVEIRDHQMLDVA